MPRRGGPPKRGGKRFNRGRGGRRPPAPVISSRSNPNALSMMSERWVPLTPPRLFRWLRYAENVTLTTTSGATGTYVFSANDVYDPNVTGTGHQYIGFDQIMLNYNHFCVFKTKIEVTARNGSLGTPTFGVRTDASPTPITSIERILEIGGAVFSAFESVSYMGSNKILDLSLDISKYQGVSRSAMTADPSLCGSTVASPAEMSYFHLFAFDAAAFTSTFNLQVIMESLVCFMEPRDNTQSSPNMRRNPPAPERIRTKLWNNGGWRKPYGVNKAAILADELQIDSGDDADDELGAPLQYLMLSEKKTCGLS